METFTCPNGCCTIIIEPYTAVKDPFEKIRQRKYKAGAFIYDSEKNKVLLIQSRGHLWGPPKGTIQNKESSRDCAIREVKEETGLNIIIDDFSKAVKIQNRAIYYYIDMKECDVKVQTHIEGNDANGICWIKPECLEQCIQNGNIAITKHCRIVFESIMNKIFPQSTFILIEKRTRSSRFIKTEDNINIQNERQILTN